jgi:general secretion pathway protein F
MDFEVKAVRGGEMVLLTITASNQNDAIERVQAEGYFAVNAKPKAASLKLNSNKRFPLALFSQELLALLDAGLNLVEAIEALTEKEARIEVKGVLDSVLLSLQQGKTLSTALSLNRDAFPLLYVATIKASEKTGDLVESLSRYVAYEYQLGLVKKKIISASIYPLLLVGVGSLVIIFLLGFVVPKFSRIYEGTGGDLPFLSQVLLIWGAFIEGHTKEILIATVLGIVMLVYLFSLPSFKKLITEFFWRIPALGEQLRVFQLARFYRTLGMLLTGGMPIVPALDSVSGLLQDSLKGKLDEASQAISNGQSVSIAMDQSGLTTPVALRMLRVGERSGRIGEMMERIAAFYDEELSRWIDWFTKLFEPILMLIIGFVIGLVVLLLYMPIFELAGSIQ